MPTCQHYSEYLCCTARELLAQRQINPKAFNFLIDLKIAQLFLPFSKLTAIFGNCWLFSPRHRQGQSLWLSQQHRLGLCVRNSNEQPATATWDRGKTSNGNRSEGLWQPGEPSVFNTSVLFDKFFFSPQVDVMHCNNQGKTETGETWDEDKDVNKTMTGSQNTKMFWQEETANRKIWSLNKKSQIKRNGLPLPHNHHLLVGEEGWRSLLKKSNL